MEQVKLATIKRALMMLSGCGCKYLVTDPDGETYILGDFSVPKKRVNKYEHAERLGIHVNYHIKDIQPGETRLVPFGDFPRSKLQSRISSLVCQRYGSGSCTTLSNSEKGGVEVLRLV